MTPLQTSTGVLPGADWEGRPERRVSRADWDRRLLGAVPRGAGGTVVPTLRFPLAESHNNKDDGGTGNPLLCLAEIQD